MDIIDVVNIVPNTQSNETGQDSEPSIAVNPENPQQIAITAFTPAPPGGANSPIYFSVDGGLTWQLNFDMPFHPNPPGGGFPGDQTISFATGSGELFGAFLRRDNQGLLVFRTDDITSPAVLPTFGAQAVVDQPWVEARKVVGGVDDGKYRVYVGYNDNNIGMNVATATVEICLDALAAAPVFTTVKLNPRAIGAGVRDFYAVRPVSHADGTVYVAYERWSAGAFGANVTADVVVARDDHWGAGATPFTDLKDPGDGLAGSIAAANIVTNDGGNMGQERLDNDLAIAVDPTNSSTVYVAWADNVGPAYTVRVRRSVDRGVHWSADLLTVPNATMAALTINSVGTVGLMYQELKNNNWETHFRRTTDATGTAWNDVALSRTPSAAPVATGQPYLGDWARITAVGTTFYGTFCANNTPDPANFPNGVKFERNRTKCAPYGLLGGDRVTPVAASIDPFFFRIKQGIPKAAGGAPAAGTGSLLIPSAVALLAHRRLADVVDSLQRKIGGGLFDAGPRDISDLSSIDVGTVAVNDAERRVLGLAKAALQMFQAGPPVDVGSGLPVGQGFGRFAVAGSAAFELPAYAELFTRNGSWVADTIRRGTPDENFSKVVVGSTQLAVRAGELGVGIATDDATQARIQSFSMGMLSALASDVVVGPVLRGLQMRRAKQDWSRSQPAVDIAAAEERIVRNLLGGRSGAAAWQGWWPDSSDIPDALFDGYLQAVEEAYGITANRPKGFSDFEKQFFAATPPPLTRDRLRDGYTLARLDAQLASWGTGTWYVALLPMLVVPIAGFALVRALPHGQSFVNPAVPLNERAAWEVLTLGTGLGALAPAGYSIYLWTQVPENTEAFVEAVVMFGLRAALGLGSIAAGDASAAVRWGLLYAPLAAFDVYSLVRGLIERASGSPAGFVFLLQTIPVLTGSSVLLWSLLSYALIQAGADKDVVYIVMLVALAAVLLAAVGIPLAVALSHGGGLRSLLFSGRLSVTEALESLSENGGPQALAALFDDSTLWFDPAVPPPGPTLADLRYPAGRRAVVRLWWTGAGDLQISHDEHTVTFKKQDGSTKDVVLPPGKTAAIDLATLLMAQMPGICAEPFDFTDPSYDLPYPHTLTDLGDTQPTIALHDAHVHDFAPLGTGPDEPYLLRHTPRDELVTLYGENGPSVSQLEAIEVVPGEMLGDLEQSALGTAADLAALLCMAAAPSLAGSAPGTNGNAPAEVGKVTAFDPPGRPALGNLSPVFQVFRQWNLDERRVNEWRMLVQGGADRDQSDPVHADPGMRPNPVPGAPAYVNAAQNAPPAPPAPAPDVVARALGWVPLWRAWSRMASDVTADSSSAVPMSYTPSVTLGDGTQLQPSNADLTNAIRFLLDLA